MGGLNFMLRNNPILMDTSILLAWTDIVESVADPDWEKGGVYTIYSFGSYTYLQPTICMTTPTNDKL